MKDQAERRALASRVMLLSYRRIPCVHPRLTPENKLSCQRVPDKSARFCTDMQLKPHVSGSIAGPLRVICRQHGRPSRVQAGRPARTAGAIDEVLIGPRLDTYH